MRMMISHMPYGKGIFFMRNHLPGVLGTLKKIYCFQFMEKPKNAINTLNAKTRYKLLKSFLKYKVDLTIKLRTKK